jgi:hypothetical protein
MRQLLIFASGIFLSLNTLGQIKTTTVPPSLGVDTTIKVSYENQNTLKSKPAYYLNGQLVNENIIKTINPKSIEDIIVKNENIIIENQKIYHQIFIKTKTDYNLRLISLTDLKLKYTDLKKKSTLFMVNGEIINDNYDKTLIDENYILKISVEKIENRAERLKFNLVKIWTKTDENIRESNEVWIKGIDEK